MKIPVKASLLVVRVLLGAGLFWIVATRTGGWDLAIPALSSPGVLLPVVAFSIVGVIVEAVRLSLLLRSQGMEIPLGRGLRLVTAAFALNFCVPGGATGDLSKVFYLRAGRGDKGWELATVVFVDRLVGLVSLLLLLLVLGAMSDAIVRGSALFMGLFLTAASVLTATMVFAALCLSRNPLLRSALARLLRWMPFRAHIERVANALWRFSDHRNALLLALVVSFVGNVAGAAVFALLGWTLFAYTPIVVPAFIALLGMFANTVSITPGGLGVGEAAFEILFGKAGIAGGAAMMILWRIGMLPLVMAGIGIFVAGLSTHKKSSAAGETPKVIL